MPFAVCAKLSGKPCIKWIGLQSVFAVFVKAEGDMPGCMYTIHIKPCPLTEIILYS